MKTPDATATRHSCERKAGWYSRGLPVDYCKEATDGFLWIGTSLNTPKETRSVVEFCPFCGYKAKRLMAEQDGFQDITEDTLAEAPK